MLPLSVALHVYCHGLFSLSDWFFPLWLRSKSCLRLVDAIGEVFVDWRPGILHILLVHYSRGGGSKHLGVLLLVSGLGSFLFNLAGPILLVLICLWTFVV